MSGFLIHLGILQGLIINENHANPRQRQERLRGVDPAWHCKGQGGGSALNSIFKLCCFTQANNAIHTLGESKTGI